MEIMKMFGRVFSGTGNTLSQGGKEGDGGNGGGSIQQPVIDPVTTPQPLKTIPAMRCVVKEPVDRDVRKSRTGSRILSAEFTVEETKTYDASAAAASEFLVNGAQDMDDAMKLKGVNWESAAYVVDHLGCSGDDEVTAIDVSDRFIAIQYHVEATIDIFDRRSKERVYRLEGHDFGGQCLVIRGDILYSGSMDKTVRSWYLGPKEEDQGTPFRRPLETIYNHLDYVQCLSVDDGQNWVASGGRGDKDIYVYETDANGKLWRRHHFTGHEGWVTQLAFVEGGDAKPTTLVSGSEDSTIRLWCLLRSSLLRVLPQDEAITCMAMAGPELALFGDNLGKLSFLDLRSRGVVHLLPNILVGTGRYCRSSKYHDKAVDVLHVTGNGFIVTASQGSKFVKIWRLERKDRDPDEYEKTEVTELQILREHTDYLTTFRVHDDTIYSSCVDGRILFHTFPKDVPRYEMATEQEPTASTVLCREGGGLASNQPEEPTEVCPGPRLCRTGKTGLVRSSSSFQVSFQLKPPVAVAAACSTILTTTKIRLPATVCEESEGEESEDEEEEESEEDESNEELQSDEED